MSKFIGRLADVGFAKEAVRGTAETAATYYLPKLSLSYDDEIMQVVDESSVGVIEDSPTAVVVGKLAAGEIEGNIYDKSIGLLLLNALGSVSTSGPSQTTVYTHTFSVGQDAQHDSLTLFVDDPNQDYKYALAMIESLGFDIAIAKFSTFTAAFRSKIGATATLTPSYTAENAFLPQHGTLKTATDLSGLGAASTIDIRSIKLNISKNIEDDRKLGSTDPSDILNKQIAVDGTIELIYDAQTFKTEMLADTQKAMRIRLSNTDVTIGSSLNPQLTIDLAKVKFGKFTRNYGNDDITTVTAEFKAFYSISDSKMITMELINTAVSY